MKPARFLILILISASLVLLLYLILNLDKGDRMVEESRFLMGTIVRIKAPAASNTDEKIIKSAVGKALDEIARIEDLFSVFKEDSEISRINRTADKGPVKVNGEVFALIEKSVSYSRKTDGAFDITVKPLIDLWSAAKKTGSVPSGEDIDAALTKTGSKYIGLNGLDKTVSFKRPGMALDMGGVAKGYASDMAVKILRQNGIKNAIVNPGGDVYCIGRRSKSEMWDVGIRHPRVKSEIAFVLKLEDKVIDTAGDYEKYFMCGGKRYSHIIDPRTGYPIGDNVVSSTVIAKDAATADILATALCILGEKGLETAGSSGADALIIMKEGGRLKVRTTEGMKERYDVSQKGNL